MRIWRSGNSIQQSAFSPRVEFPETSLPTMGLQGSFDSENAFASESIFCAQDDKGLLSAKC